MFDRHDAPPALVLLRADRPGTLWDAAAARLLDDVESRLDPVFVTSAGLNGSGPTLGDALAAARFSGSRTAVVVVVEAGRHDGHLAGLGPLAEPALPLTWVRCPAEPDAIVAAYRAAANQLAATA